MGTQRLAHIFPAFRYRDAPGMITWLKDTLGFSEKLVVPGENQTIAHAQLVYHDLMIMVGSVTDTEYGQLIKHPDEVGGHNTQSCYFYVADIEDHYKRAEVAGAEILIELREEPHGGKYYLCKDPEGYLWNFGSYDPWAE